MLLLKYHTKTMPKALSNTSQNQMACSIKAKRPCRWSSVLHFPFLILSFVLLMVPGIRLNIMKVNEMIHIQQNRVNHSTSIIVGEKQSRGGYSTLIQSGDTLCHLSNFNEYYQDFSESRIVPFGSSCLKAMIQEHPSNLHLRIAHVRRRYIERVSNHLLPMTDQSIHNQSQHMHSRHIIFYCRGNTNCGGIGDRLRGMARAFFYALAFNATFTIVIDSPDEATSHFYRWDTYFDQTDDLELTGRQSLFHSLVLDKVIDASNNVTKGEQAFRLPWRFVSRLPRSRTVTISEINGFKTNVVDYEPVLFPEINTSTTQYAVVQTNQFLIWGPYGWRRKKMTVSNPYCNQDMFRDYAIEDLRNIHLVHMFLQLYASKPTLALSEEIWKSEEKMQGDFVVGLRMRMGRTESKNIRVPFSDPKRHSIESIPCLAKQATQICSWHTSGANSRCTLFVVSDSIGAVDKVRDEVRGKGIDVVTPDGNPHHIDKPAAEVETVMAGNMKLFADWFILGNRSDALIISRSGFSLSAAVFRNNGTSLHYRTLYEVQEKGPDSCVHFTNEIPEYAKEDWGMDRLVGKCSLNPWNLKRHQTYKIHMR